MTYLRCKKLGRPAESAGPLSESHALFTQSEIGDFDVALGVEQQIVQLQVSVHDFVVVQVLETEDDTAGVEHGTWLREHLFVDVHHEIATRRVLHHKTYVILEW